MAKIIGFGRCVGKTTMAILESHATGQYILCSNHRKAEDTFRYAKELGYTIPYPLSVTDPKYRFRFNRERLTESVIVDDVEESLETLLGCSVSTITFSSSQLQQNDDRYIEEIAELKKELDICQKSKEEYMAVAESLREVCINQQKQLYHEWDKEQVVINRKRMNRRRYAR